MLKDNDVIKALKCCSDVDGWCLPENRKKCPLYGYTEEHCDNYLMKATLDLINRQKEDIEMLEYRLKCHRAHIHDLEDRLLLIELTKGDEGK